MSIKVINLSLSLFDGDQKPDLAEEGKKREEKKEKGGHGKREEGEVKGRVLPPLPNESRKLTLRAISLGRYEKHWLHSFK